MYLKSIMVQGFKSFANKIVFEFQDGITAIVGPNGSGKSNVSDAVRWVLGEQRVKELRGGSMQDVIFSGTENRKPLSYAFVAITFDNSDKKLQTSYEEVTVTRKLFRSGESEYLLNGKNCRLKDINELFYDTGIGKDGYSIIGQGQIDRILNGKPDERREIFDEAAGIVKYKRRKELSEKKLENERQNLLRVNDILSELERQVEPLKRQSDKAKKYLSSRDFLKKLEINSFLDFEKENNDKKAKFNMDLTNLANEKNETQKKFEDEKNKGLEKEIRRDEVSKLEEKKIREETDVKMRIQEIVGNENLFKEKIRSIDNIKKETTRLLENNEKKKNNLLSERERLSNEASSLKEKLKNSALKKESARNEEIRAENNILSLELEIEEIRNSLMDVYEGRTRTKGRLERLIAMEDQAKAKKASLSSKLIEYKSMDAALLDGVTDAKNILDSIRSEIQVEEKSLGETKNLLEEVDREGREKKAIFEEKKNQYNKLESRLETLRNMAERYEGFNYSVKKVMEARHKFQGDCKVVADILRIDKEYQLAAETALGGGMQNIVTDDEKQAKALIEYLKKNKYGRATFLPVTSVKKLGEFRFKEALNEEGVIGLLSNLVYCDEKYKNIKESLLGKTLVCKDIDSAVKVARKYSQSIRIVTLQGELINPGGSMTGGAFRNSSNLLSRKNELIEMDKEKKELKIKITAIFEEVAALKEKKKHLYEKIDSTSELIRELRVSENEKALILSNVKRDGDKAKRTAEEIKNEAALLLEKEKEIADSKESIEVELLVSKELEEKLKLSQADFEEKLIKAREEKTDASEKLKKVEMDSAHVDQKNSYLTTAIEKIDLDISFIKEEIEHNRFRLEEALKEENKIEENKESLIGETDKLNQKLEEIKSELKSIKENLILIKNEEKKSIEIREGLQTRLGDLKAEEIRLYEKISSLKEKSDKKISYMWDTYSLTYHGIIPLYDDSLPKGKLLLEKIRSVKDEIKALGNVNVAAVDEYKEVSDRYEFLSNQQKDLVLAEKNLVDIIAELEESMREQFKEQFNLIQKEFNKVFKVLFGGGRGTITLMDGDPLSSGIEIIAQPPGKKLQNMMQLSGGEKALTAIALLFAIQNLRPSPFCLLDEIEAALD